MAKNLIPSCCKVLLTNHKNAKFAQHTVTRCCYSIFENNTNKNVTRQYANHLQAANVREKSTDTKDQKKIRKSDLSKLRFFFDPKIDKAMEKPIMRLSPMTLLYTSVANDYSHLFKSATFLRNEMPTRLAHLIKELRQLPFIIAANPEILEIHERCINTFHDFERFAREINDVDTEVSFNKLVFDMLNMNKDLLALLCDGFKEARKYITNESFIRNSLNKILSVRLGIRLLCEHHIALNKQSDLKSILFPSNDGDDLDENGADHQQQVDHFVSKYVPTNNGNGGSSGDSTNMNPNNRCWVGIINKKFSPKELVEKSGKLATRICKDKYGVAPKLKIDGHTNAQFIYLPLPLQYILPELLKNAFRATVEHHNKGPVPLPDVSVTIAVNDRDFIIRLRDRGGGIPHSLMDKIFDYHFTTAKEYEASNGSDSSMSPGDETSCSSSGSSGMGILLEPDVPGAALMHGFGFGLPTSKAYAEYLGGSLTCQSMQGIGSDFYLRLGLLNVEKETVRI